MKKYITDEILEIVIEKINMRFNQENMPNCFVPYNIGDCVVFFWHCGAIILRGQYMRTISEDDGSWFESNEIGIGASSAWIPDIVRCMKAANDYLVANGKPYYYSGTDIICGYEL